jgi:hypothetical protein
MKPADCCRRFLFFALRHFFRRCFYVSPAADYAERHAARHSFLCRHDFLTLFIDAIAFGRAPQRHFSPLFRRFSFRHLRLQAFSFLSGFFRHFLHSAFADFHYFFITFRPLLHAATPLAFSFILIFFAAIFADSHFRRHYFHFDCRHFRFLDAGHFLPISSPLSPHYFQLSHFIFSRFIFAIYWLSAAGYAATIFSALFRFFDADSRQS